jgi:inner membrane protein
MDVTTHVSVAAFAAVGLAKGKVAAKEIRTAVFLGSMAPDIDSFLYLIHPSLYFEYHRVYTHTLLGVALLSAVTAWLITFSWGERSFWNLSLYAIIGGLIHLGLDTITRYPLHPLAPFSSTNYALGLLWWRDPFFKIAALIGIGLILLLPRFLARPLTLLGLSVMATRVGIASLFRR